MESQSRARKLLQNFGFLTVGKTLGDVFTFVLFVSLSRVFGQEGIGLYSFAMGLTGFFAIFADFGLHSFSIKGLSRRDSPLPQYFGRILSLRVAFSLAVFAALLLALPFLPFPLESKLIILVIGVYQVAQRMSEGFTAVLISREDTLLAGAVDATFKAVTALGGIAVVLAGGSLAMAVAALMLLTGGQMLVAYPLVARRYGRPKMTASWSLLVGTARQATPYAGSRILTQLYTRADVVLLGFFLGAAAAGLYNVAYRVVFLLMFIPQYAATAVFPLASRLYTESREEFEELYGRSLSTIVLAGLPIAAGVWLIAPDIIRLTFGQSFAESVAVLRILAGLLFVSFLSRTMGVFLMSSDRQVERMKIFAIVAGLSVALNLTLIPIYGIKGAALAALSSELVLMALFAARLRPVVGWPRIGSRLAIAGLGAASFCLVFTLLPALPLAVVVPGSALLYSAVLLLFRDIRNGEVRTLVSIVKGGRENLTSGRQVAS